MNFELRADLDLAQDGPALLKLAVEAELADAARSGEEPHIDMTALLMIGGADPGGRLRASRPSIWPPRAGIWLAALVMDRWGRPPLADP